MEYGYMINGQLIRQKTPTEQSKPLVYTEEPPVDENHGTVYAWVEENDNIVQVWSIVEVEKDAPPDDIDEAEAFDIIFGGAE